MKRITAEKARKIIEPGLYRADPTLYLQVSKTGAKSWIQRLSINGKRRDIGLGSFSLISLAKAREFAVANRVELAKVRPLGIDPFRKQRDAEREAKREAIRQAKTPTFRAAYEAVYQAKLPTWRSNVTERNFRRGMEIYALPLIGDKRMDTIGRADTLAVLAPIWAEKTETARRLRGHMSAVFAWAMAHGHCSTDWAGDPINGALPKMPAVKKHLRALPHAELPAALADIEASAGCLSAKYALRFIVLTGLRVGEVRMARWSEVDIDAAELRIPGDRMKAGREHRVPLSDAALDVLRAAKRLDDGSGLVFPSPQKGRALSDRTIAKVLDSAGLAARATVHGFRSTFRDWCADTGKPREIAEAALAHTVGGVEGAYFRSDLFERRRVLMAQWAAFVTRTPAAVVELRA